MTSIALVALLIYVLPPISHSHEEDTQSSSHIWRRRLGEDKEDDYPEGYPPEQLTFKQRENGGWILYFLGMCYTFIGIALVCDEWFVPAIEVIVERIDMTPDAAGATFMAAGGSAPELFTSLIGTFISRSNVGFGTIVGSAVFNVLFVIGCCAIFTPGHLPLTWWPFARDCLYYIMSLVVLAVLYGVVSPNEIMWWESVILLLLYVGYVTLMFYNVRFQNYVFSKIESIKNARGRARRESKLPRTMHFHASLYDFLTKDSTVSDLMGVHIVSRMKGETRETFNAIDTDSNGHIDRAELRRVLHELGEDVTDETAADDCFDQIDTDHNGEISYAEFEQWYLASQMRITSDIRSIFSQFDADDDECIDCDELLALLQTIHPDGAKDIGEAEVAQAMKELGKKMAQTISVQEFIDWYAGSSYFEAKKLKRQATLLEADEDGENGICIEWPHSGPIFSKVMFVITAPIMYSLYYSLPDVQKQTRKKYWPATFAGSMLWLMFYSYLMVWWATRIGEAWHVPPEVMGLTFLAAGTSVPDLLSSVIVAKLGQGDMAVSSSIGSNIFDILIGLPFPWLLFSITLSDSMSIHVQSQSLFLSVIILICMLCLVLCVIKLNSWKLTHKLGWTMFVLWILFVIQDLIRQFCDSCN
eukprot:472850_1